MDEPKTHVNIDKGRINHCVQMNRKCPRRLSLNYMCICRLPLLLHLISTAILLEIQQTYLWMMCALAVHSRCRFSLLLPLILLSIPPELYLNYLCIQRVDFHYFDPTFHIYSTWISLEILVWLMCSKLGQCLDIDDMTPTSEFGEVT